MSEPEIDPEWMMPPEIKLGTYNTSCRMRRGEVPYEYCREKKGDCTGHLDTTKRISMVAHKKGCPDTDKGHGGMNVIHNGKWCPICHCKPQPRVAESEARPHKAEKDKMRDVVQRAVVNHRAETSEAQQQHNPALPLRGPAPERKKANHSSIGSGGETGRKKPSAGP